MSVRSKPNWEREAPIEPKGDGRELPEGWAMSSVGDCFLDVRNGTTATQNKHGVGIPVSRIETIQNHRFDMSRVQHLEDATDDLIENFRYRPGDIALSHINSFEHVGKTALYEGEPGIFIHGMNLLRLRLGHEFVEPRFAHLFMQTEFFREEVRRRVGHAVNQVSINQKNLAEVPFVIAPLVEQRRIVAKVEALLGRVNAARERLARVPTLLRRFRQSVLAAACDGRLTADWRADSFCEPASKVVQQIRRQHPAQSKRRPDVQPFDGDEPFTVPDGWSWATLSELGQPGRPVIYGIIKPGPHVPDGVPYVRVTEMKGGTVDLAALRRTSPAIAERFRRATLMPDDILISKDGTIGRVAIVPVDLAGGNITQHLVRASVAEPLSVRFVSLAVQCPALQRWLIGETLGVALQGVNVEDFRRLPIPIPSPTEQHEIVRRVDALFKLADAIERRVADATRRVERVTQAILAKAFRGELVPTEAELARLEGRAFESAEELLERVRGEGPVSPAKVRARKGRSRG